MLTDSNLNLTFCWMPKMGSTFWKRAWPPLSTAPNSKVKEKKARTSYASLNTYFKDNVGEKLYHFNCNNAAILLFLIQLISSLAAINAFAQFFLNKKFLSFILFARDKVLY